MIKIWQTITQTHACTLRYSMNFYWRLRTNGGEAIECNSDDAAIHHNDVMTWTHFRHHCHFVRGIHWSPVDAQHKGSVHYNDVIMSAMAFQITGIAIVCSTVGSGADQRKYQSSASLAFVRGIHRLPVNSPLKRTATRKMFSSDDVIMNAAHWLFLCHSWIHLWTKGFISTHFWTNAHVKST